MNIKELRRNKKLSQQDLSDATGIPKARIEKWEVGKGAPKMEDYIILQNFFGLGASSDFKKEIELDSIELDKESKLASIASNIKLEYVVGLLAEIQERLDSSKSASIVVSNVQKLSQLDFESKLNKLKSL